MKVKEKVTDYKNFWLIWINCAGKKEKGDSRTWGIGLVNLGRLQAAMGDADSARTSLRESRDMLRAIGERVKDGRSGRTASGRPLIPAGR